MCPPSGEAFAIDPAGRLGPSHLFNVALSTLGSRSHVAVVETVAGHELPRVAVDSVPRLLAGVQRAAVGHFTRANVLDEVDGAAGVGAREAEHDGVGVGTNDGGVGVEHSTEYCLGVEVCSVRSTRPSH